MSETKAVYTAINLVQSELAAAGISKGRVNKQQEYNFRGIDDMYNALAPLLAKHKLVILPSFAERVVTERQTRSGGVLFYTNVAGTFTFVSSDDGSTVVVGPFFGEAMDSGDKSTNKAQSASFKYMAMQTFCIPTQETGKDAEEQTHDVTAKAPDGFEDMVADLEMVAGEQGVEALQAAWKGANARLRKHFTDTNKAGWEAIKAKAVAFDAAKAKAKPELSLVTA